MRWSTEKKERKRREKSKEKESWHKWFAWYPVNEGYEWYWLEFVDRKYTPGWWGKDGYRWSGFHSYRGREK